ncbi:MAG: efflux RND transporter periplasmic adaptor subunit [Bryobacteraceae bacterium]
MKTKVLVIVLAALVIAALAWYGHGRWYGSSHAPEEHGEPAPGKLILYYHCPMHPDYKSDKPGSCPICGMHLEPVYAGEKPEAPAGGASIPPEQQQRYGIVVGQPTLETATLTVRALGVVQPDETRIVRVHPKVEGWIEEVHADFTGRYVKRGEPLVTVYSPELLISQQEYLLALRARNVLNASTVPGQRGGGESLALAARRRLELWDLPPEVIEEIAREGSVRRTVPVLSPADGYVMARNAYRRQRIIPETELYTLADLSRVWVMAEVFESDAGAVRLGQNALVQLAYAPSRSFPAKVQYIQPAIDPATRTLKVRLEVENPRTDLKPDMYVNVEIRAGGGRGLFVPTDAVLDTGLSRRVFVVQGDGHFEPREVQTGREWNGKVEILRGLSPQDRIVTSGVFLVDSESRLRTPTSAGHSHDQQAH